MKKLILYSLLIVFSLGIFLTVSADSFELLFIGNDPIFSADSETVIYSFSDQDIDDQMTNEKADKLLDKILRKKQKKKIFIYNGIEYKFAEVNGNYYTIPLANSPNLFKSPIGYFFVDNNTVYKIEENSLKEISKNNKFMSYDKEMLSEIGYVHWIEPLKVSANGESLFYRSNRRALALEGKDYVLDLWKIDLTTGEEELIAEDIVTVLYDSDTQLVVTRDTAPDIYSFKETIISIVNNNEELLVKDTDRNLGSDNNYIYYKADSNIYKYDLNTGISEALFNLSEYVSSSNFRSSDGKTSVFNTINQTTGLQGLLISEINSSYFIDLPQGFSVEGIFWIEDQKILVQGNMNNGEKLVNYTFDLSKGKGGNK